MCTLFSVELQIRVTPEKIALRWKIKIQTVHFSGKSL